MSKIHWTPKSGDIPSRYGVYSAGATYMGLPYSLAIKTDSHIGTQVSLYTFMTAIDNPFSVLYTEDLRKPPYSGSDCAPYYGTTCSNSVLYALGVEAPFYTYKIRSIPGMVQPRSQSPDDVEECDLLLKTGHVVMVYEVEKDTDGSLTGVKVFETTAANQKDTWIRDFTGEEFRKYWYSNGFVRLQYSCLDNNIEYEPSMFVPMDDEFGMDDYYPLILCTTRGDRASYRVGQDVDIAVLIDGYCWIELYKDDEYLCRKAIDNPLVRFQGLSYGLYKAFLLKPNGDRSNCFTSFEIIDANAFGEKGDKISIHFSSKNASARYVCICDEYHNPFNFFLLGEENRNSSSFEMDNVLGDRTTSYKVFFKGKYGVVSTEISKF